MRIGSINELFDVSDALVSETDERFVHETEAACEEAIVRGIMNA